MRRVNEDAASLLFNAARALERAKQAAVDGGAPTIGSYADADLEEIVLAEIDCAQKLIARALTEKS